MPSIATGALRKLATQGRVGRFVAAQADLVLSIGPPEVRRQGIARAAAASSSLQARRHVYSEIWRNAAEAISASVTDCGDDFWSVRTPVADTVVWFHHVTLDNSVRLEMAANKGFSHRQLVGQGLPVAPHLRFNTSNLSEARSFVRNARASVLKPAQGTSGGEGVTCGVSDDQQFDRALIWALRWGDDLMLEGQARGDEFRFLFLDGELLDVVKRRAPEVVGDGTSTVVELIAAENLRRARHEGWLGMSRLTVDLDCIFRLGQDGLTLRSVLPAGRTQTIKGAISQHGAKECETVPVDQISSQLIDDARTAARCVGVRLAGVDLITVNPATGLREGGGVIVEVNGTPGLHYHYLVADRAGATPVAVPILSTALGV